MPTRFPAARRAMLYNWRFHQRGVRLSDAQRAALDALEPGWHLTKEDRWGSNLTALVEFSAAKGRLPVQKAADPTEAKLAAWLATQRKNMDALTDDRTKLLDAHLPSWRQTRDDVWAAQLHKTAAYLRKHGSFPKSSTDSEVRQLASWMGAQRYAAQKLSQSRLDALDATIPGWRNRTEAVWLVKLEAVAAHRLRSGALPSRTATDANEARMGFWLSYQRKTQSKLSAGQTAELDARAPGWRG